MMKKLFVLLLLLTLLLTSCASSLEPEESHETENTPKTEETETESDIDPLEGVPGESVTVLSGKHNPDGFSVGFARYNISPEPGVGLAGFGTEDTRLSEKVLDELYVTCTAVSDGEETLLLFSVDSMKSSESAWKLLSQKIEKELGIPQKNIIINATHSHSVPSISHSHHPTMRNYMQRFYAQALECAKTAVADLDKATVKIGRTYADNLNFVRRYIEVNGVTVHETEADNEMQIIYFERENQKDVVLMNWQSHYCGGMANTAVSADWVCGFRRNTETKLEVYSMFLQGAGGNLVCTGTLPGEYTPESYMTHGVRLSDTLLAAVPNLVTVEPGKIQAESKYFDATYKDKEGTEPLPISVLSFGPVSFATVSYEMIDTNGKELKAATPFDMTFVCGYTNGAHAYIPSINCFENGGYEVSKCYYVPGTGEAVVAELLTMLKVQHDNL